MKQKGEIIPGGVEEYISEQPKEIQEKLIDIRSAIQKSAPGSTETVSYFQMPGYFYEGYAYNGMFAWFSYKKPYIRLHVIPPVIDEHKKELSGFKTTKAIVSFPADEEIPAKLVMKLVKASIKVMKDNEK